MKSTTALSISLWVLTARSFPCTSPPCAKEDGQWTNLAPIGRGAAQEHGTAAVGSNIYIVGGIPSNASNTGAAVPSINTVSAYSIPENSWRNVASMPLALTHANVAAVDSKIFVLGGLGGNGSDAVWRAVPDCFVYDPGEDKWTTLPPMPAAQARGASAVGVFGQTVYLAGGMTSLALVPGGLQASVDLVTAYDVARGTWTTLPSLPAPRDHVGGVVVGRMFFVVGGRDHGQENGRNTTFAMDLDYVARGWVAKAPMPTARGGLSIGVIGDHIVTFGGEGNPAPGSNGVFNETEAYDMKQDKWVKLGPMPVPRHGTIAASVTGRIYIPGGGVMQGAGPILDMEQLTTRMNEDQLQF